MSRNQTFKFGNPDEILAYAQQPLVSVLDPQNTKDALKDAISAFMKQAEALKNANYKEKDKDVDCPSCQTRFAVKVPAPFNTVAQSMAYTAKVIDEMYRLASFASGGPDSRAELTIDHLLQALTNEQFSQVLAWIEENKAKEIEVSPA